MDKKVYITPQAKVIRLESDSILTGSTGATGEDIPWGAKRIDFDFTEE